MKNRLSYFLLSLLGFATACRTGGSVDMYAPPRPMYGSPPPAGMCILGKITDTAGRPIKDIEVVETKNGRKTRSQDDGTYVIAAPLASDKAFDLRFQDTDGPANGGSFKQQELRVVLTEEDLKDGYDEVYLKSDVDVQLAEEDPSVE